jgi:hypothetical protein
MLMAFDQGLAMLWVIGQMDIDADMVREVILRMLRPTKEENRS